MGSGSVQGPSFDFNIKLAQECIQSFSASTGIGCLLIDPLGTTLYRNETSSSNCNFCKQLQVLAECTFDCAKAHNDACFQAQRFGGKYIYLCPCGMAHFVSLITSGGITAAGFIGGPVLIVEKEDFIQHDLIEGRKVSPEMRELFSQAMEDIPVFSPDRVSHFSNLQFMLACFVSGYDNYRLMETQEEDALQGKINEYIQAAKQDGSPGMQYPIERERELLSAITQGDKELAQRLLNELLGYIFFGYGSSFPEIKVRVTELIVLLSRAAIAGGADQPQILALNYRYLNEIHRFTTLDDLSYYLAKIMNKFTEYVFPLNNVKHVGVMYKALNYISNYYMNKITLEDVASQVFFSPSYFSKVFKDEMHCNFNAYLNQVRIDKSKKLLLADREKLVDIADMVGFEDQSYFSKVFKRSVGITPGKFRELRGQLPTIKNELEEYPKGKQ